MTGMATLRDAFLLEAATTPMMAMAQKANDRPVLMGEFGAYEKSGTPMAARVRYTATVRREAEAHGFPWAYWQSDSDFILYDIDRDQWVEPIREALVPMKQ